MLASNHINFSEIDNGRALRQPTQNSQSNRGFSFLIRSEPLRFSRRSGHQTCSWAPAKKQVDPSKSANSIGPTADCPTASAKARKLDGPFVVRAMKSDAVRPSLIGECMLFSGPVMATAASLLYLLNDRAQFAVSVCQRFSKVGPSCGSVQPGAPYRIRSCSTSSRVCGSSSCRAALMSSAPSGRSGQTHRTRSLIALPF